MGRLLYIILQGTERSVSYSGVFLIPVFLILGVKIILNLAGPLKRVSYSEVFPIPGFYCIKYCTTDFPRLSAVYFRDRGNRGLHRGCFPRLTF